jgi:hypothetical protein
LSPAQVRDEFLATCVADPIALQNVASEPTSGEIRERGAFRQEAIRIQVCRGTEHFEVICA